MTKDTYWTNWIFLFTSQLERLQLFYFVTSVTVVGSFLFSLIPIYSANKITITQTVREKIVTIMQLVAIRYIQQNGWENIIIVSV